VSLIKSSGLGRYKASQKVRSQAASLHTPPKKDILVCKKPLFHTIFFFEKKREPNFYLRKVLTEKKRLSAMITVLLLSFIDLRINEVPLSRSNFQSSFA